MSDAPAALAVRSPAADAAAGAVDRDELLTFARALLAAPSENPGGSEDEAADVACDILAGLRADPEIVRGEEGRPSVVARIGAPARPSLASTRSPRGPPTHGPDPRSRARWSMAA
jgi:acetylornithine deacetylase/succinyl-diaminopimelate desuccinylase-like protein